MSLVVVSFVAGLVAGVSPCVLPLFPLIFVAWTAAVPETADALRARRRRALTVVAGLVVSFGLFTAAGSVIVSALHLPQALLRDLGIFCLIVFGLGLAVPRIGELVTAPFQRFHGPSQTPRSAFLLGVSLGLVFVPCAGPVLAAITILGARHQVSLSSLALSFLFAAGSATPMLIIALAGDRMVERNRRLSRLAQRWRPASGVILVVMALAIAFNLTAPLQRALPGYTQSLQNWIEGNPATTNALRALQHQNTTGNLVTCENEAANGLTFGLAPCGAAPNFTGITAWLNTPGNRPLTMARERGHVVLIDFWTYSCINCQRSLPHVEAWYQRYHRDGLDVIGIEAPEFTFEHVVSNIAAAAKTLGVHYPIAIDDNLATWNAYENQYWPAEYLIDATGTVRHVDYGEGAYGHSESLIRQLLLKAHPGLTLPPPTSVPDLTPTNSLSPETYLGTERAQYLNNGSMTTGVTHTYRMGSPQTGSYDLGGTWTPQAQYIHAGANAALSLFFQAQHVYLVLGGTGTVRTSLDGRPGVTIHVHGYPTLYTLVSLPKNQLGLLTLSVSPGVDAYDFTFG